MPPLRASRWCELVPASVRGDEPFPPVPGKGPYAAAKSAATPTAAVSSSSHLPRPQEVEVIGTRGTKITRIGSLAAAPALESICLRSNLIGRMRDVAGQTALKHLELYENRIRALEGLEGMTCEPVKVVVSPQCSSRPGRFAAVA